MTISLVTGFSSATELAQEVAVRIAEEISKSLSQKGRFDLVLTGGGVGILTLEKLAPMLQNADLAGLHLWWGDERFVGAESPERNELQAREALISKIAIPQGNLHPFPSSEFGAIEEAGRSFGEELEKLSPDFDLVLLGIGPDGHIASLFPKNSAKPVNEWVVVETNSPKPPSQRLSLSYEAINSANKIWILVSGAEKAEVVSQAYLAESELPLARVSGKNQTLWFLDDAAASKIIS